MKLIFIFTTLVACASAQWDANFANDRFGIVHLFEWHWDTIADECETVFQDYKIGGVQVSAFRSTILTFVVLIYLVRS